jgi:membrane AbrB-like protein
MFTAVHLPAGVLLGCMLAGIGLSSRDIQLGIPTPLFALAQGVLGCLMARSLQPSALAKVAADWPVFLLGAASVMVASAMLGWIMMRRKIFPGTTAVWGLAPGAASAMVLMAESYGADVRLVAFMQYLRVAVVTASAALVARLWAPHGAVAAVSSGGDWWVVVNPVHVGGTMLLAFGGALVARKLRLPAGAMVLPLLLGTVLQAAGGLVIELPAPLLAWAYAMIGWSIGLRFTRTILQHALRALPQVLGSIVVLMGVGVVIAAALSQLAGIDPLTAYLATSPGGADSVAVIAATSAVDAGFVMAMQLARFLMVLVFGPQVSKFVATRAG